jgi:hypothetical protein
MWGHDFKQYSFMSVGCLGPTPCPNLREDKETVGKKRCAHPTWLLFASGMTGYTLVGSYYEERDLAEHSSHLSPQPSVAAAPLD